MNVSKKKITEILFENSHIKEEQMNGILSLVQTTGKSEIELLIERGVVSEELIADAISKKTDIPFILLSGININEDIIELIDPSILKKKVVMPFSIDSESNTLYLAMANPMDIVALDDIAILSNMHVEPYVATSADIMSTIDRYYGSAEARSAAEAYT